MPDCEKVESLKVNGGSGDSASGGQHVHHSLPLFKTIAASPAACLASFNLPPKRPAMLPSVTKKTRKSLTLEVKLDIIHRHERREN
ncbi:hypothetical protein E2C01_008375 [Portunus trituberculatus]|uniref:Uncharacterized protein n=1 Tax=Portunus trituberculatus TaxID=210409 RepID=A0A5B7D4I0_PORTR|nr:hypothetical protein [Portunus trituberculatus]